MHSLFVAAKVTRIQRMINKIKEIRMVYPMFARLLEDEDGEESNKRRVIWEIHVYIYN